MKMAEKNHQNHLNRAKLTLFSLSILIFTAYGSAYSLEPGWNMISVTSQSSGIDYEKSSIEEKCGWEGGPWTWKEDENNYVFHDEMKSNVGYWVKVEDSCDVNLSDNRYSEKEITLDEGWNMVSRTSNHELDSDKIDSKCGDLEGGPWTYDNDQDEYEFVDTISSVQGYWVKVSEDCNIDLGEDEDSEISEGELRSGFEIYFEELKTGEKLMSTEEDYPMELKLEDDGVGSMESDSIEGEFKIERHGRNHGWEWEITNYRGSSSNYQGTEGDTLPLGDDNKFEVGGGGFNEIEDATFVAEIDIKDGENEVQRREFKIVPSEDLESGSGNDNGGKD